MYGYRYGLSYGVGGNIQLGVSISAPSSSIYWGDSVTFTATTNVPSPSYQWKLNGSNVGTDSATYINATLEYDDIVTCVVNGTYTSNAITMIVGALNAYLFDGSTKYAEFGDILDSTLAGTNPTWTISCTILRTSITGVAQTFLSKWTGGGSTQRGIIIQFDASDKIRLVLSSNGTATTRDIYTNDTFTSLIDYYTVDVVKNGSTITIYVNGVAVAVTVNINTSDNVFNSTTQLRLARHQTTAGAGTSYFAGYMNQVHIWSTALSGANILDKYNSGAPKNPDSYGTLIGSWISDTDSWDGSNWTVYDRKSSNDGVTVNVLETDRY